MDKNILYTAIQAALAAGAEIMSVYTDPTADFEIEKKADNSPLTIADRKFACDYSPSTGCDSLPRFERRRG